MQDMVMETPNDPQAEGTLNWPSCCCQTPRTMMETVTTSPSWGPILPRRALFCLEDDDDEDGLVDNQMWKTTSLDQERLILSAPDFPDLDDDEKRLRNRLPLSRRLRPRREDLVETRLPEEEVQEEELMLEEDAALRENTSPPPLFPSNLVLPQLDEEENNQNALLQLRQPHHPLQQQQQFCGNQPKDTLRPIPLKRRPLSPQTWLQNRIVVTTNNRSPHTVLGFPTM